MVRSSNQIRTAVEQLRERTAMTNAEHPPPARTADIAGAGRRRRDANPVEIRDLRRDEVDAAVGVLARGMRDNPLHVAAYGDDPERRLWCHARLMRGLFDVFGAQQPICAVRDGALLGVTGVAPAATCQPTAAQRIRLLPSMLGLGPRTAAHVGRWLSSWARHDLHEPHVHLGPLAVDAHLQGRGTGSLIMREHCRRLDAGGHVGYLETDKRENVRFYGRFGFEVIGEEAVIGVPNWFMRRAPHPPDR
jgi:ribosomal protein S18 acetylase RimI-like enzyme